MRIGIDLMGNENSPEKLLEVLKQMKLPSGVELVFFGVGKQFTVPVEEFIAMDDPPLAAFRKKKGSSLSVGLRQLKSGQIDAFISAGNTGALVSGAKLILGNIPGILRPALMTVMPTKKKSVVVLDVGANVKVKTAHLVQFAHLGASFCKARGISNPLVGLLNIGSEAIKGTEELRAAYSILEQGKFPFRFAGNIEGKSVFEGDVDVLVSDGFTGNIFLKTAEGIASLVLDRLQDHPELQPKINDLLHYAEYPGALLIGVSGIVIKCHGYSTPQGFVNAVLGAVELVKNGLLKQLLAKEHVFRYPGT